MPVGSRDRGPSSGQGLTFCRLEVIGVIEVMRVDKLNRIIIFYKRKMF